MSAAAGDPGLARLVGFGRLLRQRGLPVGTGRILTFCRAVAALDRLDRRGVAVPGDRLARVDEVQVAALDRRLGLELTAAAAR